MLVDKELSSYGLNSNKKNFFIAEIGINHGGSLKKAIELIDEAVDAKADAVKFQTYISHLRAPKDNDVVLDILKKCELKFSDFKTLKEYSDSKGIQFFSTPFDIESAEYLGEIGIKLAKIASFDTTNINLLKKASSIFDTLIVSTGMTSIKQIDNFIDILKTNNCKPIILHCISSYPMEVSEARLSNIPYLLSKYPHLVGYSDHSPGIKIPLVAIALGAKVIEKHFMLENDDCIDKPVSITKKMFKNMVEQSSDIHKMIGDSMFGVRDVEKEALTFRRY